MDRSSPPKKKKRCFVRHPEVCKAGFISKAEILDGTIGARATWFFEHFL